MVSGGSGLEGPVEDTICTAGSTVCHGGPLPGLKIPVNGLRGHLPLSILLSAAVFVASRGFVVQVVSRPQPRGCTPCPESRAL
jgi:hypothetical protein